MSRHIISWYLTICAGQSDQDMEMIVSNGEGWLNAVALDKQLTQRTNAFFDKIVPLYVELLYYRGEVLGNRTRALLQRYRDMAGSIPGLRDIPIPEHPEQPPAQQPPVQQSQLQSKPQPYTPPHPDEREQLSWYGRPVRRNGTIERLIQLNMVKSPYDTRKQWYNHMIMNIHRYGVCPKESLCLCIGTYEWSNGGCPYKQDGGICLANHNLKQCEINELVSKRCIHPSQAVLWVTNFNKNRPVDSVENLRVQPEWHNSIHLDKTPQNAHNNR